MPSLDFEVSDIPDIIEAQLTLSYSRLTQLLHSIVDQGNGHESDIAKIHARLDALENENRELQMSLTRTQEDNAALRNIIEDEKKEKESGGQISSDDLVNKLSALQDNVEELTTNVNSRVDDVQSSLTSQREQHRKQQDQLCNAVEHMKDNFDDLQRKMISDEQHIELLDAFVKLWNVDMAKMSKLHSVHESNDNQREVQDAFGDENNKIVDAKTQYLLSLKPFESLVDELSVLKAMQVQQAADALSAKMAAAESVRSNRSNSQVKRAFDSPLTASLKNDEKATNGAAKALHSQQQYSQESQKENDLSLLVHELEDKVAQLEANQKRLGNSIIRKNNSPLLASSSSSSSPNSFSNAQMARQSTNSYNNSDRVDSKRKNTNTNLMSEESLTPEAIHEMVAKDVAALDNRMKQMEERLHALLNTASDAATLQNDAELPNANQIIESQAAALLPAATVSSNSNTSAVLTDVRLRVKSLEDVIYGMRKSVHFATSQQQDAKAMTTQSLPDAYNKQESNNTINNMVSSNEQNTMHFDHLDGKPQETTTNTTVSNSGNDAVQPSTATLPPLVPEMNKPDNRSSSAAAPFATPQHSEQQNNTHVTNINANINTEGATLHNNQEQRYEGYLAENVNNVTSITPTLPSGRVNEMNKEDNVELRCTQVACDTNDGLCKRVSELEKNVTLLDLHKADRAELRQLQLAIETELASLHKTLPLDVATDINLSNGKFTHTPRRPLSANSSHNAQHTNGQDANLHSAQQNYSNSHNINNNHRPRTANAIPNSFTMFAPEMRNATPSQQRSSRLGTMPWPTSSSSSTSPLPQQRITLSANAAGRPVYVSGSSVNLRDGARLTSATISPTQTM